MMETWGTCTVGVEVAVELRGTEDVRGFSGLEVGGGKEARNRGKRLEVAWRNLLAFCCMPGEADWEMRE